jgi:hypothetical protein
MLKIALIVFLISLQQVTPHNLGHPSSNRTVRHAVPRHGWNHAAPRHNVARAIGTWTTGPYNTQLTESSKKLLEERNLWGHEAMFFDISTDNGDWPCKEEITWREGVTEFKEEYYLCTYYVHGFNEANQVKVYVHKDELVRIMGKLRPPNFKINAENIALVQGKIHFGYLRYRNYFFDGKDAGVQLFFVIHNGKKLHPYQHMFKTEKLRAWFRKGVNSGVTSAIPAGAIAGVITAVLGASAPVVLGAAGVAAAAGAGAGWFVETVSRNYFGDFLRYIG